MKTRSDYQKQLDSQLTSRLNNHPHVQKFMFETVSELCQRLNDTFGDSIVFYVKGGTAFNLLKLKEKQDNLTWSDWDLNVAIDPSLPVGQWYEIFIQLDRLLTEFIEGKWNNKGAIVEPGIQQNWLSIMARNSIEPWQKMDVEKMQSVRREMRESIDEPMAVLAADPSIRFDVQSNRKQVLLSEILHPGQRMENPVEIVKSIDNQTDDKAELDKKREGLFDMLYPYVEFPTKGLHDFGSTMQVNYTIPTFYLYRMVLEFSQGYENDATKLRAELLDISVLRRDNPESLLIWEEVKTRLINYNDIPVPNYEYHYMENITMLFESMQGRSHSEHKAMPRLNRAKMAMEMLISGNREVVTGAEEFVKCQLAGISSQLEILRVNYSEVEYFALIHFLREVSNDYHLSIDRHFRAFIETGLTQKLNDFLKREGEPIIKAIYDISAAIIQNRPRLTFAQACQVAEDLKDLTKKIDGHLIFSGYFGLALHCSDDKKQHIPICWLESDLLKTTKDASELYPVLQSELEKKQYTSERDDDKLWVFRKLQTGDRLLVSKIQVKDKTRVRLTSKEGFSIPELDTLLQMLETELVKISNFHLSKERRQLIRVFKNS